MARHADAITQQLDQARPASSAEPSHGGSEVINEELDAEHVESEAPKAAPTPAAPRDGRSQHLVGRRRLRLALSASVTIVVVLATLVSWLAVQASHTRHLTQQRSLFLQTGRQAATNLTTIDAAHADADVQRITESATGAFYDDFSKRAQAFVDVVKQAQTKSEGTITEAGIESEDGDNAQVLVSVTVKTSNAGSPEQNPRAWRMRISLAKVADDQVKVSNIAFVP